MRRRIVLLAVIVVAFSGVAGAARDHRRPVDGGHGDGPSRRAGRVEVMTQNVYVGADIFRVFDAQTPEEVPVVVAGILQTVFDTDFPARAEALAEEVHRYRPHLIGLQEVSLLRVQSPGDFLIGNPQPAETVLFDYLDLLLAQLSDRGLHYRVAAVVENADVELPFLAGIEDGVPTFDDVRLTDRDVILARADVATSDELAANYAVNFQVPFGPGVIDFRRGLAAVDARIHGRAYRFANTHLEVASIVPEIQQAQTQELLAALADEELPVIVVGDFNSSPDDPFPSPYGQLAAAGFDDAWLRALGAPPRRNPEGFTCCQTETLDNPESQLSERIDLVWLRPGGSPSPRAPRVLVRAVVVGDRARDRTDAGLWPSDHAGLVVGTVLLRR